MDENPKSCRRWFRFGLRTLLLLVTIASCGFGWFGMKLRQAQQQKEAIAAIEELGGFGGGFSKGDYEIYSTGRILISAKPSRPSWLRSVLGDEFLEHLTCVQIGPYVTDAGMVHLQAFTRLEALALLETDVTDAGLAHLQRFSELKLLVLGGSQFTDSGMVHLQGISQLRVLSLNGTQVTEKGCQELQKVLPNLKIHR